MRSLRSVSSRGPCLSIRLCRDAGSDTGTTARRRRRRRRLKLVIFINVVDPFIGCEGWLETINGHSFRPNPWHCNLVGVSLPRDDAEWTDVGRGEAWLNSAATNEYV